MSIPDETELSIEWMHLRDGPLGSAIQSQRVGVCAAAPDLAGRPVTCPWCRLQNFVPSKASIKQQRGPRSRYCEPAPYCKAWHAALIAVWALDRLIRAGRLHLEQLSYMSLTDDSVVLEWRDLDVGVELHMHDDLDVLYGSEGAPGLSSVKRKNAILSFTTHAAALDWLIALQH